MILGIGIDTVDVARFATWHTYTPQQLRRIFSHEEITYALSTPHLFAQRLAVRFAAREALFKALSAAGLHIPFLTLCKATTLIKSPNGVPRFLLNWHLLQKYKGAVDGATVSLNLSLTHTATTATAYVVVEKCQ